MSPSFASFDLISIMTVLFDKVYSIYYVESKMFNIVDSGYVEMIPASKWLRQADDTIRNVKSVLCHGYPVSVRLNGRLVFQE